MSSLIKATNRLISKEIYVVLFDNFNECLHRLITKGMHVILFDVFNGCPV